MTTVFDNSKCSRCGTCGVICPAGVITIGNDSSYPEVLPVNAENCILCGHCEAVCPKLAVRVVASRLQEAVSLGEKAKISAEQIGSYIRFRRSIRVYEQKAVPKQILDEILDIARYAPTAMNAQPVKWIVVHDSARLKVVVKTVIDWMRLAIEKKLPVADALDFAWLVKDYENGNDPICRNAPHLIVTYAHKDNPMSVGDSYIALSNFELAAPAFDIGTCWAGFFRIAAAASVEVQKELGIPDGHVCTGAMMVGFPKYHYKRIPKRNKIDVNWL